MEKDRYFKEGDVVILRAELPNKPVMMIDKIVRSMIKTGTSSLLGIRCFWYDRNGTLNKHLHSTKDIRYATPEETKKKTMTVFKVPSRIHELIGVSIPDGVIHHSDKFYYFKYMSSDVLLHKSYFDMIGMISNELVKPRPFPEYDFIFDFAYPWRESKGAYTFGRIIITRKGEVDVTLSTNYTKNTKSATWKTGTDLIEFLLGSGEVLLAEGAEYQGLVPSIVATKNRV
jgi:hypothetical protein